MYKYFLLLLALAFGVVQSNAQSPCGKTKAEILKQLEIEVLESDGELEMVIEDNVITTWFSDHEAKYVFKEGKLISAVHRFYYKDCKGPDGICYEDNLCTGKTIEY